MLFAMVLAWGVHVLFNQMTFMKQAKNGTILKGIECALF